MNFHLKKSTPHHFPLKTPFKYGGIYNKRTSLVKSKSNLESGAGSSKFMNFFLKLAIFYNERGCKL
ncbi:hypothetical protein C4546_04725 [Candidatus Parcubacteria bacterium]|nr:MAG: hypothetical protein C4546_04725 [Candidatus Parcubacteria bacterium]